MHLCKVWVTTYSKYLHDTAHVNVLLLEWVRCKCTQQPLFSALLANMSPATRPAFQTQWQWLATEVMLHITRMGDVTQCRLPPQNTAAVLPTVSHPHCHMSKCPAKERLHKQWSQWCLHMKKSQTLMSYNWHYLRNGNLGSSEDVQGKCWEEGKSVRYSQAASVALIKWGSGVVEEGTSLQTKSQPKECLESSLL